MILSRLPTLRSLLKPAFSTKKIEVFINGKPYQVLPL